MFNGNIMAVSLKQPTYKRQQFLLALIQQIECKATATDLQKIVFLYSMNNRINYYDFVPYKYGAYSFQLAQDVEVLCKNGYINTENRFSEKNKYSPTITIDSAAVQQLRGDALVREAYIRYPYYAINSEIMGRILNKKAQENVSRIKQDLNNPEQKLFSIGYEGKTIEEFVNILLKKNIRLLCDVRRNPLSRKFGFSKEKLRHILEAVNITYIHIPELGIASENRQTLQTPNDYRILFDEYKNSLLTKVTALEKIYALIENNRRIALMCYEEDPCFCHRTVIKEYLENSYHTESEDL